MDSIEEIVAKVNKLGVKGIQVVGYIEAQRADSFTRYLLVVKQPELTTASGKGWYDD